MTFKPVGVNETGDFPTRVETRLAAKFAPFGATASAPTPPVGVGCKAWTSAALSVLNATDTAITFDSETYDTDGFHDPASNPTRLTVPAGKGGLYLITAGIRWGTNATGVRTAILRKNNGSGVNKIANQQFTPSTAGDTSTPVNTTDVLVPGDYIELVGNQTSGGSLSTSVNGSSPWTFLSLVRIGT